MRYRTTRMYTADPADTATGGATTANPAGGAATVTFTPEQQKAIDAITGGIRKETTAKVQAETEAALLKRLGVTKPEDAEDVLKKYAALTEAQKSEKQKQDERTSALEKEVADGKEREKTIAASASEKLLKAVVIAELTKAGYDASLNNDAWLLIKDDKDLRALAKPKGDDDFEGVDALVKKFGELRPKWAKVEQGEGSGVGSGQPGKRKIKLGEDEQKKLQEKTKRQYAGKW